MQRDALAANQIDEAADGCECVPGADSDEHVVAFTNVPAGLGSFNECPGQVGCFYVSHCTYRVLLFHSRADAGLSPSCEGLTLTSSHGHTIREKPVVVSTWISTVPPSVTVPPCRPSRTSSPIQNFIRGSVTAIAVRNRVAGLLFRGAYAN